MFDKNTKISKNELIVLGGLFLLVILFSFIRLPDGRLHIYFLNVGQGDAMFIQTPNGSQILIDGGPDDKVLSELGRVMPFYDRSIDMIVSTHLDADHVAGLIEVLKRYSVDEIVESGMDCTTVYCKEWDRLKDAESAKDIFVHLSDYIVTEDGVEIAVLNPFRDINGQDFSKRNNEGVVLKLKYKNQSVLFTADIEASVEHKLVLSGVDIDSDFLKVGHHGSRTSTTEEFLRKVSPVVAFIEVGAHNSYGHPTKDVLDRLESFSIPYYRTDIDGRIELILDGNNYKINKTQKLGE